MPPHTTAAPIDMRLLPSRFDPESDLTRDIVIFGGLLDASTVCGDEIVLAGDDIVLAGVHEVPAAA